VWNRSGCQLETIPQKATDGIGGASASRKNKLCGFDFRRLRLRECSSVKSLERCCDFDAA